MPITEFFFEVSQEIYFRFGQTKKFATFQKVKRSRKVSGHLPRLVVFKNFSFCGVTGGRKEVILRQSRWISNPELFPAAALLPNLELFIFKS